MTDHDDPSHDFDPAALPAEYVRACCRFRRRRHDGLPDDPDDESLMRRHEAAAGTTPAVAIDDRPRTP